LAFWCQRRKGKSYRGIAACFGVIGGGGARKTERDITFWLELGVELPIRKRWMVATNARMLIEANAVTSAEIDNRARGEGGGQP